MANKATHITRTAVKAAAEYRMDTFTDRVALFVCQTCHGELFRVATAMDGPLMQLLCAAPRCNAKSKVLEMHKPEMTEPVAKMLGLWTPSMNNRQTPAIDVEIEAEN